MCEAARIAFPRTRIIPAVRDEERRFLERFRGRRSERFVCLAKILGRHETTKKFQDYLVTCERMRNFTRLQSMMLYVLHTAMLRAWNQELPLGRSLGCRLGVYTNHSTLAGTYQFLHGDCYKASHSHRCGHLVPVFRRSHCLVTIFAPATERLAGKVAMQGKR